MLQNRLLGVWLCIEHSVDVLAAPGAMPVHVDFRGSLNPQLKSVDVVPCSADLPGTMGGVWPTAMCVVGGETWTLYCGDSEGTVSVFQRSPTSAAERFASAKRRLDSLTMEQ